MPAIQEGDLTKVIRLAVAPARNRGNILSLVILAVQAIEPATGTALWLKSITAGRSGRSCGRSTGGTA